MKEKTIQIKDERTLKQPAPAYGLHFISDMNSDIGTCRRENQDACCVRTMTIDGHSLVLAAVCDGVGGMQEGGYASRSTIQFLNNWFDYTISRNIRGDRKSVV